MNQFRLTAEQEAACFMALEAARIDAEQGRPGMIVAQITLVDNMDVVCTFAYVGHDRAEKVKEILAHGPCRPRSDGGSEAVDLTPLNLQAMGRAF